jgi:hypothetical protein
VPVVITSLAGSLMTPNWALGGLVRLRAATVSCKAMPLSCPLAGGAGVGFSVKRKTGVRCLLLVTALDQLRRFRSCCYGTHGHLTPLACYRVPCGTVVLAKIDRATVSTVSARKTPRSGQERAGHGGRHSCAVLCCHDGGQWRTNWECAC